MFQTGDLFGFGWSQCLGLCSKIQYHLEKLTKKGSISTERRKKRFKITITRIGKLYDKSRRNRKFNILNIVISCLKLQSKEIEGIYKEGTLYLGWRLLPRVNTSHLLGNRMDYKSNDLPISGRRVLSLMAWKSSGFSVCTGKTTLGSVRSIKSEISE